MKNFLILLMAFLIMPAYAQSGRVEYSIKSIEFTPSAESKYSELTSDLKQRGEKQKFHLVFNPENSIFSIEKGIDLDESSREAQLDKMASLRFGSVDTYYFDKKKNLTVRLIEDGSLIKQADTNWQISQETKNIDSYICFKATTSIKYLSRLGDIKEKIITAWFAPILPYAYGPKGYNGLPGLILELQDRDVTYLATKIELRKDKIEINVPKGRIVNNDQYEFSLYRKK